MFVTLIFWILYLWFIEMNEWWVLWVLKSSEMNSGTCDERAWKIKRKRRKMWKFRMHAACEKNAKQQIWVWNNLHGNKCLTLDGCRKPQGERKKKTATKDMKDLRRIFFLPLQRYTYYICIRIYEVLNERNRRKNFIKYSWPIKEQRINIGE